MFGTKPIEFWAAISAILLSPINQKRIKIKSKRRLVKQLANWKNDPYSKTLAGIGQYQVEIEFLLECAAKLKAQEEANIAQNIQNTLNIVIDEVIKNKTERTRYRHQESEVNNAYLIGLAMRNGAGV